MAKRKDNYERSYTSFLGEVRKGSFSPNMLLFIKYKILLDELIRTIGKKFIGDGYDPKQYLISFFTDESDIGSVINECANTGMFSDKKIVLLRVVRKPGYRGFNEDEAKAMTAYFKSPNPDVIFIIIDNSPDAKSTLYDKIKDPHLEIIALGDLNEAEFLKWVKHKFGDYKIDDDTIMHLIQLLNMSVDDISQEIEKLKTYALESKEITKDDVNMCIGFSRDFNENDFIYAVLQRDAGSALKIYNSLILKRDVEIFLLILLNSAFTALSKMFDSKIGNFSGWDLKMKLKIWNDFDKMFPVYKKYRGEINELKIKQAFGYIGESEKALKSSGKDKKTVFTQLITNLVNL